MRQGLDATVEVLATVNRRFTMMKPVSRAQFDAFTRPALAASPQIELIAWQRQVGDAERHAFEEERRRSYPGFAIRELAAAPERSTGRSITWRRWPASSRRWAWMPIRARSRPAPPGAPATAAKRR